MDKIVVIGGGHAAAQLCAGLAEAGWGSRVHLVCEENTLPYQRPPLSKTFLKSATEVPQVHRAEAWYAQAGITLHLGDPAVTIDRAAHTVRLRSGASLDWAKLVLATGTRARMLPSLPASLDNVVALRLLDEAHRLRERLHAAGSVVVLGGGFIGLEVAATALALGKQVIVLEGAARLLGRAVSPEVSAFVLQAHRAAGMDIRLNVRVGQPVIEANRVVSIEVNGEALPVDLLIKGIGASPETALAEAAGLECADGVVVDALMQTSDADVLAIGDCTRFPDRRSGQTLRLESVQNANDQARTAVATLTGTARHHDALPWFWSDQGKIRLQMAGLMPAADTPDQVTVRRPGANDSAFSLFHYAGGQLRCVESVNAPADHLFARKLMEAGHNPAPEKVADPAILLKSLLA